MSSGYSETFFNIVDYGATGDGKYINTLPIQQVIDRVNSLGGGTVYFPAGIFVSAPLELKSNVNLYLENGAVLKAVADSGYYGQPEPLRRFLFAKDAENITISGYGTIDGNGINFGGPGKFRPYPLLIQTCRFIQLKDFTIKDSPAWTIKMQGCDYVTINGITILNNLKRVNNTDGIDPDGCRFVRISNCHIEAGDDAIVVKSTNQLGKIYPSEDIIISNCTLVTRKTALKCGTETWGDIRNIVFSNCTIYSSGRGLGLWMRDGGTIDGVIFSNISMNLLAIPGESMAGEPIRIYLTKREKNSKLGRIQNILIENLTIDAPYRCYLYGHEDQYIEGLTLNNIRFNIDTGKQKNDPAKGYIGNSNMSSREKTMIDAFYCRNIKDLKLKNISVNWLGPDSSKWRSTVACENVEYLEIDSFSLLKDRKGGKDPIFSFCDVKDAYIHNCWINNDINPLLKISGSQNKNIKLDPTNNFFKNNQIRLSAEVSNEVIVSFDR